MPAETYGAELATGWIARLFPYLETMRSQAVLEAGAPNRATHRRKRWITAGVNPAGFPCGLSQAPIKLVDRSRKRITTLRVYGGFAGVAQTQIGALRPEIAWGVAPPTRMQAVIDRLLELGLPEREDAGDRFRVEGPAAMFELYDHVGGGVLFERWTLRRFAALAPSHDRRTTAFCDLDDGRTIALRSGTFEVVCGDRTVAADLTELSSG